MRVSKIFNKKRWYKVTFYSGNGSLDKKHLFKRIEVKYIQYFNYDSNKIIEEALNDGEPVLVYVQGNLPREKARELVQVFSLSKYYPNNNFFNCKVKWGTGFHRCDIYAEIEEYEI